MKDELKQAAVEGFKDSFRLAFALVCSVVMGVATVFGAFVTHKEPPPARDNKGSRSDSQFMRG